MLSVNGVALSEPCAALGCVWYDGAKFHPLWFRSTPSSPRIRRAPSELPTEPCPARLPDARSLATGSLLYGRILNGTLGLRSVSWLYQNTHSSPICAPS